MTTLQLWIVVGVPTVVAAVGLLAGGSPARARAALGLLVILVGVFTASPGGGRGSAAAVGILAVLLVAGGRLEGQAPPPPGEARRHLTTAGPAA